jgi:hypothetical protein
MRVRPFFLLSCLRLLGTPTLAAQTTRHEYRPEVIVTLPRWHGVGLTLIDEQHVATGDLAPTERQQGAGLVSPSFAHGSAGVELRQVTAPNGVVEHRWQPSVTLAQELGAGLELRDRVRLELRDIAGHWSKRYQNRATVARPVAVGGRVVAPYAHFELSYDTRYHVLNRREVALGVRVPVVQRTTLDWFLMRQTDTRRSDGTLLALGLIARVAL